MPCFPKHPVRNVYPFTERFPIPLCTAAPPVQSIAVTVDAFVKRMSAFCTEDPVHVWVVIFRKFFNHRTFGKVIPLCFNGILCLLPEFRGYDCFMVILDIPSIYLPPVSHQFSFFIHKMLMHDVIAFVDLIFNETEHRAVNPLCTAHGLYPVFIQITLYGCRGISVCCHLIDLSYPYRFLFVCNIDSPLILLKSERPLKILHWDPCLVLSLVHHLCTNASALAFCLCKCSKDRKHKLAFP